MLESTKRVLRGKTATQTGILYASKVFDLLGGIVSSILLTRGLGPVNYGIYSTFLSIIGTSFLFFRFGLGSTSKYLLANAPESEEKNILGASAITALFISILFALFIFILSFFIDPLLKMKLSPYLRLFAPFLLLFASRFFILCWATGLNKITLLALTTMGMKLSQIIMLLFLFFVLGKRGVAQGIFSALFPFWVGGIAFLLLIRPRFDRVREKLKEIWATNKRFGLKLYVGQIANQPTYKLDRLFIARFASAAQVGFYNLADQGTLFIIHLPAAMAQSLYKRLAKADRIPGKVIRVTILWLFVGLFILYVAGPILIRFFFSQRFIITVQYIYPLGIAAFFQGLYQPFLAFLSSHGRGNEIRNIAITEGIINVFVAYFLVKNYGAMGACFTSAIAKFSDFLLYLYYYKRCLRSMLETGVNTGNGYLNGSLS